jgi:hypothetical protein
MAPDGFVDLLFSAALRGGNDSMDEDFDALWAHHGTRRV